MAGYELEKDWDQFWRLLPRKEEFEFADITDEDLRSRYAYVTLDVESVEHCARLCFLGSACDTFFVEFDGSSGNNGGISCTYIPHVGLKAFNLIDFVNFVDSQSKEMYVLQCSQAFEETYVDNTDPFTHSLGDWTETFTCGGTDAVTSLQVENIKEKSSQIDSALLGFQFMRKMPGCLDSWEYQVEKQVTSSELEARGFTQDYINKIKPIAWVRSAPATATANSETCAPSSMFFAIKNLIQKSLTIFFPRQPVFWQKSH